MNDYGRRGVNREAQLQLIKITRGDSGLLALATVDLAFPGLPDGERAALRSALEAAAVPHWCDADMLARLADDAVPPASSRWQLLRQLSIVEPFPARGTDAGNVQGSSRLAIRRMLAKAQPERFRELSAQAASIFEADTRPAGRIEWLYHLLTADPERGVTELQALSRAWWSTIRHEELAALAAMLVELDDSRLLRGAAMIRARLIVTWQRLARSTSAASAASAAGAATLSEPARQLLEAARAIGDARLTGDACCLVGDVARASGELVAAQQAYAEDLAISEELAELHPASHSLRWDLGCAFGRVAQLEQLRGNLIAADEAYNQCLAIFRRLSGPDPANIGWLRELALAYCRCGDLARQRKNRAAAGIAYAQFLTVSEQLTALDPGNTSWQHGLAVAHARAGELAIADGDLGTAEDEYDQCLGILEQLTRLDLANADWERDANLARRRHRDLVRTRRRPADTEPVVESDRHEVLAERVNR